MTKPEFYAFALRTLERLNPKQLGADGFMADDIHPCVIGACRIASVRTDRVEPAQMKDAMLAMPTQDWLAWPFEKLVHINDSFRQGRNSPADQRARWKHVHKWLTAQVNNA